MNESKRIRAEIMVGIWFIVLMVPILSVRAQSDQQVEEIRTTLESTKFPDVANKSLENLQGLIDGGYWGKLQQARKEKIVDAFIKQLRHGKEVCQAGESEEAFTYLAYLGDIAGKLKSLRTIPVLMDGLHCSAYADALASIGDAAIAPLTAEVEKGSHGSKRSALYVFGKVQEKRTVSEKNSNRIKQAITRACRDNDEEIRLVAVATLNGYGDENDIPLLKELAENDPQYYEVNTPTGPWTGYGNHKRYIVREEARSSMEKIKIRLKNNIQKLSHSTTQQVQQ